MSKWARGNSGKRLRLFGAEKRWTLSTFNRTYVMAAPQKFRSAAPTYAAYVAMQGQQLPHGRGASGNPANRFEALHLELDPVEPNENEERPQAKTQFFRDHTKTILARNNSPDVCFERSVNPYRGCEHGCAYCFARPTHEYLGFSSGLDFESKIMVKENAAELLAAELSSPKWKPQVVAMSGVTDPYQPVERRLQITRRCLEVLAKFRNPVAIITKNKLVTRDIDLLSQLAAHNAVGVNISITSLDRNLQRILEPRTSSPQARLDAVAQLHAAGIPVGVMVAPIIPGITDHEVPAIMEACGKAGAQFAAYVILRLPWAVAPLFARWLDEHFPERKEKVLGRIRAMRGGKVYDSRWAIRQTGEGIFAEQIEAMFEVARRRAGIKGRPPLSTAAFRRPNEQLPLF
jgi:DNA repair photolyase